MAEAEQDVQLLLERQVEPVAAIVDFNCRQSSGRSNRAASTEELAEVDSAEPSTPDHRGKVLRERLNVPPTVSLHQLLTQLATAATARAALAVIPRSIVSGRLAVAANELRPEILEDTNHLTRNCTEDGEDVGRGRREL